ncbi:hypothetical protein RV10_GL004027 [Enterococcus pallens]|nr:hypothetical protein RV10_GL004027 [Enterococcus pallens]
MIRIFLRGMFTKQNTLIAMVKKDVFTNGLFQQSVELYEKIF